MQAAPHTKDFLTTAFCFIVLNMKLIPVLSVLSLQLKKENVFYLQLFDQNIKHFKFYPKYYIYMVINKNHLKILKVDT